MGLVPITADSKVAVPEVTTEKSEIDKNSLVQFIPTNTGRSEGISFFIISKD